MNKWVLLQHKVCFTNSFDIHYDFLVENGIDCLTWKFLKLPLSNQASVEISKQPNHRLVWLSRLDYVLSRNRGVVKRIDHGNYINVSQKLDFQELKLILDGNLLNGIFEISGNFCQLTKNF